MPYAFQLLAGPAGAVGPDAPPYSAAKTLETDYPVVASQAAAINAELESFQQPGIGLVGYPGLTSVYRLFDNAASTQPSSVDFFTPDTFGYTTLDWNEIGNLTVNFWGIKAYGPNVYPSAFKPAAKIFSFSVSPG